MAIWDIAVMETGSGGDFTLNGNDLAVFKSIEGAGYMAMFGGNTEADTNPRRVFGDEAFDWWGNSIFLSALPLCQMNSLTEWTLNKTPLTSAGRAVIENAIKKDWAFLGDVQVTVVIVSTDRINVSVFATLPNGLPGTVSFSFLRNELTGDFYLGDFDFSDFF